jgi:hypothetical protein
VQLVKFSAMSGSKLGTPSLDCHAGQMTVPAVRIPFAPPAWPQPAVLRTKLLAISPILAAISDLSSGLLMGRAGAFFSEWLISLRSSGLRQFGTVLEIRMFRDAYVHVVNS